MSDILIGLLCLGTPIAIFVWAFFEMKKERKIKKEIKRIQQDPKSVDELVKMDLDNFNPKEYNKGKRTENGENSFQDYYTEFTSEIGGVFRYLNVKDFDNGGRNYLFYIYKPNKYHRDHLRRFVDELYAIYGKDDRGKAKFKPEDDKELDGLEFWDGRRWTKSKIHPSLQIGYDPEDGLNMTIWKKR